MPNYRAVTPPSVDQIQAIYNERGCSTPVAWRLAMIAQCIEALNKAQTVDDLRPIIFTLLQEVYSHDER